MATRPPEPGEADKTVHDFPDDPPGEPMVEEEYNDTADERTSGN